MAQRGWRANEPFRLNLEQQKKRAKELLRDAGKGEPKALARWRQAQRDPATAQLADAQHVIARELGAASWPKLKTHVEAMERARQTTSALDADRSTLHIRCGSDIGPTLKEGGFAGDFLEYSDALCQGPVTGGADYLEIRARFLTEAYGTHTGVSFEATLEKLTMADRRLAGAATDYDRVVLWMEHDPYDQLVLARCLAEFARTGLPKTTELVSVNHFPGSARFLGLGQLPPEALRLLWPRRERVSAAQCELGAAVWAALQAPDPNALADIAREPAAKLPDLPRALLRHLQELPSTRNGLGLSEQLILDILSDEPRSLGLTFRELTTRREPLPWLGDLMFMHILEGLAQPTKPAITITPRSPGAAWHDCDLALTAAGLELVNGERDWLMCGPAKRWLGGVSISSGAPNWRWDEHDRRPVLG